MHQLGLMATVIHDVAQIDFDTPGKRHYQLAFHLDSSWGYSLLPLTVIRGMREALQAANGRDSQASAVLTETNGKGRLQSSGCVPI